MSQDLIGSRAKRDGHDDNDDSTLTRRTVLVTIAQAAIISNSLVAETTAPTQLPPGLYLPSSDHLGHALMWTGRFRPIPPHCPTDYMAPRTGPYTPLFFSPEEFAAMTRVTQLILGEPSSAVTRTDATTIQEVTEWIDFRVAAALGVREAWNHIDPLHRE
jgi:hypothetical protein